MKNIVELNSSVGVKMGIFGNDTSNKDTTYYNKATGKLRKKNIWKL